MKRICISLVMVFFLVFGGLRVQAKEETLEKGFVSNDGVIRLDLSGDWLLLDAERKYDDAVYDEWQINKEYVEETLANLGDAMIAVHKYEYRVITIAREKEKIVDYRGISDKQFEIIVDEIEACGRQEVQGVTTEYIRTYENEQTRYIVYDVSYGDDYKEIMYQTCLDDEVIIISFEGDNAFLENHNALNNWIDKISYEKPIEKFDAQKESDEKFFRASGAFSIKFLIVALIVGAIVQHKKKRKPKNNE